MDKTPNANLFGVNVHLRSPSMYATARWCIKALIIALIGTSITGCTSLSYRKTPAGEFNGKLDVRWVDTDYFLFIPNKNDPLTLTREDGSQIVPELMFTDGGSIPKMFWGVKGLSPWGYAPAYMIHDWMFVAKHCNSQPDQVFTFDDSINVMGEALKAIMEGNKKVKNHFMFDAIVMAVGTPVAKRMWHEGKCVKPPQLANEFIMGPGDATPPGTLITTISY